MASCLLCLQTNNDILDVIKTGSGRWQQLDIGNTIEKHFWPLNTEPTSSWICLSCWQTVEDFHKFYLRIEQAHANLRVIKVEKEEKLEFSLQDVQHHLTQHGIHADLTANTLFHENASFVETVLPDLGEEDTTNLYESDLSDDYQPTVQDNEQHSNLNVRSKLKDNDKFIAEHFKEMNCDLCKEPFIDFNDMRQHFTNIHNQRGYVVCCKKKFSDRLHLIDHLHLHLNPHHFKCTHCKRIMNDRRTLKNHIMFKHLEKIANNCYQCDMCDVSFKEKYLLRLHKSIHLSVGEKKLPCSDCKEIYDSFYPLLDHLQNVHRKMFFKNCYVCGKSINSSREFESHINSHEGGPRHMIYCDICGLGLATRSGYRRHQSTQHPVDGKKEHQCPKCPKISPTRKALRKHIKNMHTPKYKHECDICGKLYKTKTILNQHMTSHSDVSLE